MCERSISVAREDGRRSGAGLTAAERPPSSSASTVRRRDYKEIVPDGNADEGRSLPPGIVAWSPCADARSMSAAVLTEVAPTAASQRILSDVGAFAESDDVAPREPALDRLEAAIGRDFADRLVAALSEKPGAARR